MARLTGVVTEITKKGALIDSASVREEGGAACNILPQGSKVFLGSNDCSTGLRLGMEVEFAIRRRNNRGKPVYLAERADETPESRLERMTNGGITLSVQSADGNRAIEHTMVFLTWCLSDELAAEVQKKWLDEGGVARLLIVCWPLGKGRSGHEVNAEQRQLVDLSLPMTTIAFNSPGANRVAAMVVFDSSDKRLRNRYLETTGPVYDYSVVTNDDCGLARDLDSFDSFLGSGCIDADVPRELFAEKPFDWNWVNKFYGVPPRDQCAFRRRRIVAYSIQPITLGVWFLARMIWGAGRWLCGLLIVAALLLGGMRGVGFSFLCYPIEERFRSIWWNVSDSVYFSTRKRGFATLIVLVAVASGLIWVFVPWMFVGFLQFLSAVVATIALVLLGFGYLFRHSQRIREDKRDKEHERLIREVSEALCASTGPRKPDVGRLPIRPKTAKFYFAALKQQVCRGFPAIR